jgi:hypothetical protein
MVQLLPDWELFKAEDPTPSGNGAQAVRPLSGEARWREVMDRLRSFERLEENWDGFEANPPSAALIESTALLAQELKARGAPPPSRVVPGKNGSVVLEWQKQGAYAEIEVCQPGYAEGLLAVPGKPADHWEVNF